MAIVLASKPGLSGATTLNIPKTWDAAWFRNLIANQLKGADVRNAIGANGISVTGNIASPYATISIGGGPITIQAGAAGPTLTVNSAGGNTGQAIQANGDVSISQGLQVTGANVTGFTGTGAEMAQLSGTAYFQGYNRTTAAYIPVVLDGNPVYVAVSGTNTLIVSSGNVIVGGILTTTNYLSLPQYSSAGQIQIKPVGTGAALQSAIQYSSDNNLYVDAPTTGTPTGGRIYMRTGTGLGVVFTLYADGGVTIGNPTGGSKGAGTLNVASGVYLNGVAYTNP